MSVTRRTVVRGAAWSVPVVAVAAQAPAFAASSCLGVPAIASWSEVYAGSFAPTSGVNGFSTSYGGAAVNRYLSERDVLASTNATPTANATVTLSTTISGLTPGATYTLTFDLVSRFASDGEQNGQIQGLRATLGSTVLFSRQKRASYNTATTGAGYTNLANTPVVAGGSKVLHTISVQYTHGTGTSAVLTYLFTMTGRNNTFPGGSHDIAVSAPVFSDCSV